MTTDPIDIHFEKLLIILNSERERLKSCTDEEYKDLTKCSHSRLIEILRAEALDSQIIFCNTTIKLLKR